MSCFLVPDSSSLFLLEGKEEKEQGRRKKRQGTQKTLPLKVVLLTVRHRLHLLLGMLDLHFVTGHVGRFFVVLFALYKRKDVKSVLEGRRG